MERIESGLEREHESDDESMQAGDVPELNNDNQPVAAEARSLCSVELLGESIRPLLRTMNEGQKKVFYFLRGWCLEKMQGKGPQPFFIHVTGGAGTGKSHLRARKMSLS